MNTLQNTGTSLLLEQPEVVKLIWPVPLAWKHASTIIQYGMYGFLIYYWTTGCQGQWNFLDCPEEIHQANSTDH